MGRAQTPKEKGCVMTPDTESSKTIPSTPAIGSAGVTLLTFSLLVSTLSFLDRSVLGILAEPIKHDLGLSDAQLGVLTGLTFALFYVLAGLPIARYVDRPRTHRPMVIALCVSTWSIATALCGSVSNFAQMVITRFAVGAGEGGVNPPVITLINDTVPLQSRARAFAVYSIGSSLGLFLGMAVGGFLADAVGWRTTFLILGIPGIPLAILIFLLVREPRHSFKTDTQQAADARAPTGSLGGAITILLQTPALIWMVCTATCVGAAGMGAYSWLGVFAIRNLSLSATEAGLLMGLVIGVAGIVGNLIGGWAADHLRNMMLVPALGLILGAPLSFAAFLSSDPLLFAALFFIPAVALAAWSPPLLTLMQGVTPREYRGTTMQFSALASNLIGGGLAPLVIGALSDALAPQHGVDSLRYAVLGVTCTVTLLTGFVLWQAGVAAERHLLEKFGPNHDWN
jgi:MFS transporter, Spinster family, sphingosine-1-phosphate transporter